MKISIVIAFVAAVVLLTCIGYGLTHPAAPFRLDERPSAVVPASAP